MKRTLAILLPVVFLVSAAVLAQKANSGKTAAKPVRKPLAYAYLGHSDLKGGPISKHVFDSLLKQGVTVKDTLGRECKVLSFTFNYAELNLYEDSFGNPMLMTDYMMESCMGDTVSSNISASIYDRTKRGDTVYFDNVHIEYPKDPLATAKGMEFEIR